MTREWIKVMPTVPYDIKPMPDKLANLDFDLQRGRALEAALDLYLAREAEEMNPCESNTLATGQADERFMNEQMSLHAMIVMRQE